MIRTSSERVKSDDTFDKEAMICHYYCQDASFEEYELPLSHWQIRAVPEGQCIFRLLCLGQDLIKTTENGSVMDVPSLSFTTHSQRERETNGVGE